MCGRVEASLERGDPASHPGTPLGLARLPRLDRVLIGRRSESQAIERLLAGARLGRSGVLVVRGEAGIGKTALLEESAARSEGMRVLRATGSEAERDVPFGGLLQVLRPALGLIDRLPGPQAEALGAALALRPGASGDRFAVGAAALTLICRFAEEAPVVVLVDEAALLDRPSAEALTFAARRLFADPVAVLAAARSNESDAFTEAGLPSLDLGGLDASSSGELIGRSRGRDVPTALVDRLHRATGGNPLALLELAGDLDDLDHLPVDAPLPVSDALARAFAVRTSRLDQTARTLLLLAAATDGDLGVVARAAEALSLDLTLLADAERVGLVHVAGRRVEFRHPLVRSSVYSGAAPHERRAAHRALAGAVGEDRDRRAWHLSEAALGPDEEAASALALAGDGARARAAYAVAAGAYERSAALTSDVRRRTGRLIDAGQAAWLAGQGNRGLTLLDAATRLAPPLPLRRRADELRGAVQARGGSPVVARDLLIATAEEAAASAPDVAVVHLADAVLACFYSGDARTALVLAERIESLLGRVVDGRARVLGTMAAGVGRVLAGEGGTEQVREAVAELGSSEGLAAEPERTAWLMLGPLWLRESGAGRDLVRRVVADARERSAVGVLPWLLYLVARYDATSDRWAEAEVGYTEAIRLATETGQTTDVAAALAGLSWLEARQGNQDACAEHAAEAERISVAHGLHLFRVWSMFALAELELGRGETEAALCHLERLEVLLDEIGLLDVDLSPAPELADTLMRLGRVAEARAAADRLRPRAQAKGQPWALARAARTDGVVGPDAELDRHFGEAMRQHARGLDRFERARTELAYGSRLRRARRRSEARPHLRSCLETFDALGAAPWADLAAVELKATGETARRRDPSTVDDLTPQELQIAQMLAAGRTTRQAAAALFLSPKTIEYHLRHVYTKLGVSSRDELAATMRPT